MKKLFRKIKKKINNSGSSIILVVVALAFIGILVGSLLTAASALYKQKMYDYNAKDNFYYVEQAMDEIYANVGSQTVAEMQDAYSYTVDNMVRYDLAQSAYVTMGDDEANELFKNRFMKNIAESTYFVSSNIADSLANCISNSTVHLDASKISVAKYKEDGTLLVGTINPADVYRIVVKNITLTRTAEYKRSRASGDFTQTISTDIEIARPDFTVNFNASASKYSSVFDYAMIADNGVQISQNASDPLTIKGNIYAASDFYNKDYNSYGVINPDPSQPIYPTYTNVGPGEEVTEPGKYSFDIDKVNALSFTRGGVGSADITNLYNVLDSNAENGDFSYYDGMNTDSMYSGLLVKGSDVSILADDLIVPGTVGVLDSGKISVYGKDGKNVASSNIWCDNIVLSGTSKKTVSNITGTTSYLGASAVLRANVYVKDDLQLDADGSNFSLFGSYYGYGNSTLADNRTFIPTVNPEDYQYTITNSDGTTSSENRGHYNSSSIIVNGQDAVLDLSNVSKMFIAGRSYIEMSKQIAANDTNEVDAEGNETGAVITSKSYTFDSSINDYRTGESVSVKSSQLAYIPAKYVGSPKQVTVTALNKTIYVIELPETLKNSELFKNYFGNFTIAGINNAIPVIKQTVSNKDYYYYDFQTTFDLAKANGNTFFNTIDSADDLAKKFISAYVDELNNVNSVIRDFLVDIRNYEDFTAGNIILPDSTSANSIYSSGAITSKNGTTFTMLSAEDAFKDDSILGNVSSKPVSVDVLNMSSNIAKHYNYMKWSLEDTESNSDVANYIDAFVGDSTYGESVITPINTYFNFNSITSDTNIHPENSLIPVGHTLALTSGYGVWVSGSSSMLEISSSYADSTGTVRGIIFAKGPVTFETGIKKFEGMIVSGDKIFVQNNMTTISSNIEICKAILRECQFDGSDEARTVLGIFKGYENIASSTTSDTSIKAIDTIDYSDVVRYNNWMKNVE